MSSYSTEELRSALDRGKVSPIYALTGEDDIRKAEVVQMMIGACVDAETRDFNLDILQASAVNSEQLLSVLNTPPMMSLRRLVIVRDAGNLKKDVRAALEQYQSAANPSTVLVLLFPAGSKADEAAGLRGAIQVAVEGLDQKG